jgi:hypothetical protein
VSCSEESGSALGPTLRQRNSDAAKRSWLDARVTSAIHVGCDFHDDFVSHKAPLQMGDAKVAVNCSGFD